jgi:hypothetical protein
MTNEAIKEAALNLSTPERAELARHLLLSLETPSEAEVAVLQSNVPPQLMQDQLNCYQPRPFKLKLHCCCDEVRVSSGCGSRVFRKHYVL